MQGSEYNVLVVDDEVEILRTLKSYLSLNGFKVTVAKDAQTAFEVVESGKVHIVLTDISMPGMNGIDLLEKIRAYDFSIQVIIMTGFSTFKTTLQALELGATDYILKPFEDLDEVVRIINISVDRLRRWEKVLAGSSSDRKI